MCLLMLCCLFKVPMRVSPPVFVCTLANTVSDYGHVCLCTFVYVNALISFETQWGASPASVPQPGRNR